MRLGHRPDDLRRRSHGDLVNFSRYLCRRSAEVVLKVAICKHAGIAAPFGVFGRSDRPPEGDDRGLRKLVDRKDRNSGAAGVIRSPAGAAVGKDSVVAVVHQANERSHRLVEFIWNPSKRLEL